MRAPLMPTVRRADSLKTGRWPDHPRARRALAASHSPRSRRVAGVAPKPQGAVLEAHAQRDLHYAVLDVERVPVLDATGRAIFSAAKYGFAAGILAVVVLTVLNIAGTIA